MRRAQEGSPLSRLTVVVGVILILLPQHRALGRNEPPPLAPERVPLIIAGEARRRRVDVLGADVGDNGPSCRLAPRLVQGIPVDELHLRLVALPRRCVEPVSLVAVAAQAIDAVNMA